MREIQSFALRKSLIRQLLKRKHRHLKENQENLRLQFPPQIKSRDDQHHFSDHLRTLLQNWLDIVLLNNSPHLVQLQPIMVVVPDLNQLLAPLLAFCVQALLQLAIAR